jgi:hypothetical protein
MRQGKSHVLAIFVGIALWTSISPVVAQPREASIQKSSPAIAEAVELLVAGYQADYLLTDVHSSILPEPGPATDIARKVMAENLQRARAQLRKSVIGYLQFQTANLLTQQERERELLFWVRSTESGLQEMIKTAPAVYEDSRNLLVEAQDEAKRAMRPAPLGTRELASTLSRLQSLWTGRIDAAYVIAATAHEFFSGAVRIVEVGHYKDVFVDPQLYGLRVADTNWNIFYLLQLTERYVEASTTEGLGSDMLGTRRAFLERERQTLLRIIIRLAYGSALVNPETNQPFLPKDRRVVGDAILKNLTEYIKIRSARPDASSLRIGEAMQRFESMTNSLEARLSSYISGGSEPSPREFFLAAGLVLSQEAMKPVEKYRNEYLQADKAVWESSLATLMRTNNSDLTFDSTNSIIVVRAALDQYLAEAESIAVMFRAAAGEDDPSELPEATQIVFKNFGFIVESADPATGDEKLAYHVPNSFQGLGDFVRGQQREAGIPGESFFEFINAKTVGMTLATTYLPSLGTRWMMAGIAAPTARGTAVAEFIVDAMVSASVDTTVELVTNYRKDGKFTAKWEKILLESFVLGALQDVAGNNLEKGLRGIVRDIGNDPGSAQLSEFFEDSMKGDPSRAKQFYEFVMVNSRMAQDAAIGMAFQTLVEGEAFNLAHLQAALLQGTLSRSVVGGANLTQARLRSILREKGAPKFVRDAFDSDPALAKEVIQHHNELARKESDLLKRHQLMVEVSGSSAEKHYEMMVRNEFPWADTQTLLLKEGISQKTLEQVGDIRWNTFDNIGFIARQLSEHQMQRSFGKFYEMEMKRNGGDTELSRELALKRQQWELALIKQKLQIPGARKANSDIDRSAFSVFMRQNMVEMWDLHARQFEGRELITSGEAIDANEYYNVFPFITESLAFHEDMAAIEVSGIPGANNHEEAMHAIALSGGMRHLDADEIDIYVTNIVDDILGSVRTEDLPKTRVAVAAFRERAKWAKQHVLDSRREIADIARNNGNPDADDPHADLQRAKDELYQRRLEEINEKRWELFQLEESIGSGSPAAKELRAEILRKASISMRDGINTYTSPVTLDVVISRIQSDFKGPKLDADGKPVFDEDGNPVMEKMKAADRLMDSTFNNAEGNKLSVFSDLDLEGMGFDQDSFLFEHIKKFNLGLENEAATGRALGKYLERVFLSDSARQLDIKAIRERPEDDPTRRLLESTEKLVANKGSPTAIVEILSNISRKNPRSSLNGVAEMFYLMEEAFPRFKGMTGVVSSGSQRPPPVGDRKLFNQTNGVIALMAADAMAKSKSTQTMIREAAGSDAVARYTSDRITEIDRELALRDEQLDGVRAAASDMRLRNWEKIDDLARQVSFRQGILENIPWRDQRATSYQAARNRQEGLRRDLMNLRSTPVSGDIDSILDKDPDDRIYRQLTNRVDWLNFLRAGYAKDHEEAKRVGEVTRVYKDMNLSGRWVCSTGARTAAVMNVAHKAGGLRGSFEAQLVVDKEALDAPFLADWAPEDAYVRLSSNFLEGRLRGSWWAPGVMVEPPEGSQLPPLPAGRTFEARVSKDGVMMRFTNAPHHPDVNIDWAALQCRVMEGIDSSPKSFVQISHQALPANLQSYDDTFGGIDSTLVTPDGTTSVPDYSIAIYRGRTIVRGPMVPAGNYRIRVTMGNSSENHSVEVLSRKMTKLTLRTGGLEISELSPSGSVRSVIEVHRTEDPTNSVYQGEYEAGQVIPLPPGYYDVSLTANGVQTIRNVEIESRRVTPIEAQWSELVVRAAPDHSDIASVVVSIAGLEASAIILPAKTVNPSERRYFLAAGEYSISIQTESGKKSEKVILTPQRRSFKTF